MFFYPYRGDMYAHEKNIGDIPKTELGLENRMDELSTGGSIAVGVGVIAGTVGLSFLTSPLFGYIGKWLGYGLGWCCDVNPLNQNVVEFGHDNIAESAADIGGTCGAIAGGILPYYLLLRALLGTSD